MKLPNSNKAIIKEEKIKDYLLSKFHPIGRYKANLFEAFGFTQDNFDLFKNTLLKIIEENEVKSIIETDYGIKYLIEGVINTPNIRELNLVSIWFIEKGEQISYFITAYPKRR